MQRLLFFAVTAIYNPAAWLVFQVEPVRPRYHFAFDCWHCFGRNGY